MKTSDYAENFYRLAEILNASLSALKEVKGRDERFPRKMKKGYSVIGVSVLLEARRLEKQSDADYDRANHERARATLTQIEAGGDPWNAFPAAALCRLQSALRETAAGRHDREPDGHTARETAIADCLDALKRNA
jgi:hypothetical protein